jgi:serine/threonine protein kinase
MNRNNLPKTRVLSHPSIMHLLKLIKSWKDVEVVKALTSHGVTVVKRSLISSHGETDPSLLREIEIFKLLSSSLDEEDRESIITPICIYVSSSEHQNRPDLRDSLPDIIPQNFIPETEVRYLCIEMHCADGDVYDLPNRTDLMNLMIIKRAIEGVSILHSYRYCYVDLKPDNILYYTDSKGLVTDFKLIDFNSAFHHSRPQDARFGTPNTMSPDILRLVDGDANGFDYRKSDYWSIGCMAYYLLTNRHAVSATTIGQYREEVPNLSAEDLFSVSTEFRHPTPSQSILISIIFATLHLDPKDRTFDPIATLEVIDEELGYRKPLVEPSVEPSVEPPVVPQVEPPVEPLDESFDESFDELFDESFDESFDEPFDDSDSDDGSNDNEHTDGSIIRSILKQIVAVTVMNIDSNEIDQIAESTISLVNRELPRLTISKLYSNIPEDAQLDLIDFFRNLWCILALSYVLRLYSIIPPGIETFYYFMDEYLVRAKTEYDSTYYHIMHSITHQMISNRSLNTILKISIESSDSVMILKN